MLSRPRSEPGSPGGPLWTPLDDAGAGGTRKFAIAALENGEIAFAVEEAAGRTTGRVLKNWTPSEDYVISTSEGDNAISELPSQPEQETAIEVEPDQYFTVLRDSLRSDPMLLELSSPPTALTESYLEHQTRIGRERADVLGQIALRTLQAEAIKTTLEALVADARDLGARWSAIGQAAGTSTQAAHRRWDPDARKKHADYVRQRRHSESATDHGSE